MQAYKRLSNGAGLAADQTSANLTRAVTLKVNGQVWLQDESDPTPVLVELPERVTRFTLTAYYALLITESGQLWLSSYEPHGQRRWVDAAGQFKLVDLPEPVHTVAVHRFNIAVVTESGRLWMCGYNGYGQLGLGDELNRDTLTLVRLSVAVKKISVTEVQTAIIDESGAVWMCGNNFTGQLGLGDRKARNRFTPVPVEEPMAEVALSDFMSALIGERGQLWLAGYDIRRFSRYLVPRRVTQISLDAWYVAAVTDGGELWLCDCESAKGIVFTRVFEVERVQRVSLGNPHTVSDEERGQLHCRAADQPRSNALRFLFKADGSGGLRNELPLPGCHNFYGQLLLVL